MTFLFWAAAIVVFAIAEAATTALVSIWFVADGKVRVAEPGKLCEI